MDLKANNQSLDQAHANHTEISVKWMSLLHRKIRIST